MLRNVFARFWSDEAGSVIATEYLMLGSIVGLGGAGGLVSMRDAMNDELRELGHSVRVVRQQYGYRGLSTPGASAGGAGVTDTPATATASAGTGGYVFSSP